MLTSHTYLPNLKNKNTYKCEICNDYKSGLCVHRIMSKSNKNNWEGERKKEKARERENAEKFRWTLHYIDVTAFLRPRAQYHPPEEPASSQVCCGLEGQGTSTALGKLVAGV